MYGMIGKFAAQAGKRDAFVTILTRAARLVGEMPDCHLYLVGKDAGDDTTIWVTEVWTDKEAHDDSLADERVQALIAEARPLMAGPPESAELAVAGGHGPEA